MTVTTPSENSRSRVFAREDRIPGELVKVAEHKSAGDWTPMPAREGGECGALGLTVEANGVPRSV